MTWEEFYNKCRECTECSLCKTKTNTVIGKGNTETKVMFVGEAPGEKEDLKGLPFVGPAGKLLDDYLDAVGVDKNKIYICNILKCRPPHNRDPLPEEREACMKLLRDQVRLIKPQVIICLGKIAAQMLIREDFRITAEHGKWFKKGSFHMCAVYHPSALLRDASKREAAYRDFENIRNTLNNIGICIDLY